MVARRAGPFPNLKRKTRLQDPITENPGGTLETSVELYRGPARLWQVRAQNEGLHVGGVGVHSDLCFSPMPLS